MIQIGLPFDWAAHAKPGSFLVSEANVTAARHIESWREWPIPVGILSGPPRSGKSTLGRQFVAMTGGALIDDADRAEEAACFHAWNRARDSGQPLLLVSAQPPQAWPVALPDLRSRLAAAPHVRIAEPDDALVAAIIESGLAGAGTAFAPDVIPWLANRIERSYAAVADLLERLNALSLASTRRITVPLAREMMENPAIVPPSDSIAGGNDV